MPSAKAIAKGLAAGHTASKPGHWLHLCGTGLLTWYDAAHERYGQAPLPEQRYHDIDDVARITSLPDTAIHRDVDKLVIAANEAPGVKTMIVSPPTIYGQGRGPGNQRSIQVPGVVDFTLKNNFAPIQAPGLTEWDHVHIRDLGDFFVLAVDAALDPAKSQNPEIFGPNAYFFVESGTHKWSDVSKWVATEAAKQGLIPEAIAKEIDIPKMGTNSKSVAARARKYLGWEAKHPKLKDTIPEVVASEAKRLGKA